MNSVQLVNYAMTDDELADLGGPSAEGIPIPPEEDRRVTDPRQDCNGNGVRDACDVRVGTSLDCNANGIPDECEIAADPGKDCDGNGILDACQLGSVLRFEFRFDLAEASGRSPLQEGFASPAPEAEVEFETVEIAGEEAIVARFSRGTYFRLENDLGRNGGGNGLDPYTLILDVMFPDRSPSGGWAALWQTDSDNADDGDWFINPGGGVGISGNYGGSVPPGEWHRLALVVDIPRGTFTSFIDGAKVQQNVGIGPIDGRFAVRPWALLFADNDQENAEGYVNSVQLRAYAMSESEIAALGGPSASGIPWEDCNRKAIPDSCDIASGASRDGNGNGIPDECEGIARVLFIRGDTDGNGVYTLGDGIQILERIFAGRERFDANCEDAGDLDDSGVFTIGDAIQKFNYPFASGPPPAPPAPRCGLDPTPATTLGCAGYPQAACP